MGLCNSKEVQEVPCTCKVQYKFNENTNFCKGDYHQCVCDYDITVCRSKYHLCLCIYNRVFCRSQMHLTYFY